MSKAKSVEKGLRPKLNIPTMILQIMNRWNEERLLLHKMWAPESNVLLSKNRVSIEFTGSFQEFCSKLDPSVPSIKNFQQSDLFKTKLNRL